MMWPVGQRAEPRSSSEAEPHLTVREAKSQLSAARKRLSTAISRCERQAEWTRSVEAMYSHAECYWMLQSRAALARRKLDVDECRAELDAICAVLAEAGMKGMR
jgi:hypothetical protein